MLEKKESWMHGARGRPNLLLPSFSVGIVP